MKKIYPFIAACLLLTGCSKDILKKYDTRVEGTWILTSVDRLGIGGSTGHLPFTEGQFKFDSDGTLTYTNTAGVIYTGTWDIKKEWIGRNEVHSLLLTAVDYTTQDVRSEYYDEMDFTGTNHFKTYIHSTTHAYVTRFKRL